METPGVDYLPINRWADHTNVIDNGSLIENTLTSVQFLVIKIIWQFIRDVASISNGQIFNKFADAVTNSFAPLRDYLQSSIELLIPTIILLIIIYVAYNIIKGENKRILMKRVFFLLFSIVLAFSIFTVPALTKSITNSLEFTYNLPQDVLGELKLGEIQESAVRKKYNANDSKNLLHCSHYVHELRTMAREAKEDPATLAEQTVSIMWETIALPIYQTAEWGAEAIETSSRIYCRRLEANSGAKLVDIADIQSCAIESALKENDINFEEGTKCKFGFRYLGFSHDSFQYGALSAKPLNREEENAWVYCLLVEEKTINEEESSINDLFGTVSGEIIIQDDILNNTLIGDLNPKFHFHKGVEDLQIILDGEINTIKSLVGDSLPDGTNTCQEWWENKSHSDDDDKITIRRTTSGKNEAVINTTPRFNGDLSAVTYKEIFDEKEHFLPIQCPQQIEGSNLSCLSYSEDNTEKAEARRQIRNYTSGKNSFWFGGWAVTLLGVGNSLAAIILILIPLFIIMAGHAMISFYIVLLPILPLFVISENGRSRIRFLLINLIKVSILVALLPLAITLIGFTINLVGNFVFSSNGEFETFAKALLQSISMILLIYILWKRIIKRRAIKKKNRKNKDDSEEDNTIEREAIEDSKEETIENDDNRSVLRAKEKESKMGRERNIRANQRRSDRINRRRSKRRGSVKEKPVSTKKPKIITHKRWKK